MRCLLILAVVIVGCPTPTPPTAPSPVWTQCPPLRDVGNLGPIVTDIESHLKPGHPYQSSSRVNWVHEGSHGIASQLRNKYLRPGFYVLEDRAVLIDEPATTLGAVAAIVPESLRGRGYNLYLLDQQRYFAQQPSYVFDEWVAYTNGACVGGEKATVESMMEFLPYALCVYKADRSRDEQAKAFIRWQIERSMSIYRDSGVRVNTLDTLRTSADANALRGFTRYHFGADWTKQNLGF